MADRIPHSEMVEIMTGLVSGKAVWLNMHDGNKRPRPDWDIQLIRREKRALEQALKDYQRAADRMKST